MKTAAPTAANSNHTKNLSTLWKPWPRTLALAGILALGLAAVFDVPVVRSSTANPNEKRAIATDPDRVPARTVSGILARAAALPLYEMVRRTRANDPDGGSGSLITPTTYTFSTATGVALEDMSTGTTQMTGSNNDDDNSTLTNIGFDFWFDGVRYTQLSSNVNGWIRLGAVPTSGSPWTNENLPTSTDSPKLAPYWDDLCTGTNGKVHRKLLGAAPNRKLVIEWQNMQITRGAGCGNTGAGVFQLWLFESSPAASGGTVEFVYGAGLTTNTGSDGGYSIGVATADTYASITAATNTVDYAALNSTQFDNIASGRAYLFTPNNPPAAPTNLSFTGVTTSAMTLNWTDAPNEFGYAIWYSADGVNYTSFGSAPADTTSFNATGLTPGVSHFWRVYSVSEGTFSATALSGSQATNPAATYFWTGAAAGAEFNTGSNWNTAADGTGSTRSSAQTTDILIIDGAGTTAGTAAIITVNASVSVGVFRITNSTAVTFRSSNTTTRTVTVTGGAGDDFDIQAGSSLIMNNATNAAAIAFSTGIGMTGNIAGTLTLGGSTSNALTTTGGTGTVVTVAGTGVVNNASAMTGSAATLTFASGATYNHLFTTTAGTIPTATWNAASNVNVTGFTSSTSIGGVGQTFGNFKWNCTSQTVNLSLASTVPTVAGTFTVNSTGTGSLRQNANSSSTLTAAGFAQTGGTFDLSSGTGSGTLRVSGVFNRTGGTLTETGTGANNLIEFNGIASQPVMIGTISNTVSYRINNAGGIALTGTIAVPTGASMTVSSGGIPITGGTVTYTGTTSLIFNSTSAAQTASVEFPSASGPINLTINNTNAAPNNTVTLGGARSLPATGVLTLTSGVLVNGSNVLTIGNTGVGGISGGSTSAYVRGALARTLPASLTGTLTYPFPIGKGSYNPFELVNATTNAGGSVVAQAEAFDANSGGIPGTNMGSLYTDRYWAASITSGAGNFTNGFIRLTDASVVSSTAIAASSSIAGTYDLVGGVTPTVVPGVNVTTVTPAAATIPGFYALGTKAVGMTYVSSTATQAVTTPVITGQADQQVIGIQIVTSGNTSPINATSFSLNTNGTTAPGTDIINAKIWYTGNSNTFATTTQFGSTFAVPAGNYDITGSQPLAEGTNYFWLTYDIPVTAVANNVIDAECTSLTVISAQTPMVTAPVGTRTIKAPLNGTYTIGASQTLPNYTRLTDAIADLNAFGVSGPVVFQLAADYSSGTETYPMIINAVAGASVANTVTIRPAPGVTAGITGTSANALLKLNGADFVTIDGSNSGGSDRSLTINNTATNNNRAGIWLSSLGVGQGATNNTIRNTNIIGGTTTNVSFGIAFTGTSLLNNGADNDNNTIQGNSITRVFNGIFVSGTAASSVGGLDGLNISNNLVGPATIVGGNQIGGNGIIVSNAMGPILTGNTIRNLNNSSNSGFPTALTLEPGVIGGSLSQTSITEIIANGSNAAAYGLFVDSTSSNITITGTTINNVTATSASAGNAIGMLLSGTGITTEQNTISNITASAPGGGSTGAFGVIVGNTNISVSRTSITGIVNASTAGYPAVGLLINTGNVASSVTAANNVISDIQSYSDPSTQFQFQPVGIFVVGTGGCNIYFNSVNLSGSHPGLTGSTKQAAMFVAADATALDVRDNIFANTYDNSSSSTDASYAIYSNAPSTAFTNLNYNDYFAIGPLGAIASVDQADLNAWRVATGQDLQSISADPLFNSAINLQPQPGSPVLNAGTPIAGIVEDYTGGTRNVTTPSIGAYEIGMDSSGPVISYTPLDQTSDTTNRTLGNVAITDVTGVNVAPGTKPRVYYKRATDANSFGDNTSGTAGWKYTEANGTTSPFDFTLDYSRLSGGAGVTQGQDVQYFVVAQDLSATPYLTINSGTFAAPPSSVALTSAAFPIGGTINSYHIFVPLTGTISVCDGGAFPTLRSFFDAVNAGIVTGNLTVNIAGDCIETPGTSAVLNQWTESPAGSNYMMRIVPFGGVPRAITGSAFPTFPLIDLDGADRVTIDGLNTGGNALTISSTTVSNGDNTSTIRLIGDASNNTITNCTILGSNVGGNAGTIIIGVGFTTGNDNNVISYNNIGPAGTNLPGKAIFGLGTTGAITANSGVVIDHNNIYDFFDPGNFSCGIFVTNGNDQWTISNNRIYQTAPRTFNFGFTYTGIEISPVDAPFGSYSITGNIIGFANANGTGATSISGADNLVRGIEVRLADSSTPTSIQGNVIAGFAQTSSHSGNTSQDSPFIGINVGATDGLFNIGTVTGNTIGSQTGTGSITVTATGSSGFAPVLGILDFSLTEATSNIANNNIGSITVTGSTTIVGCWGIRVNSPAVSNITNNTIGGTTANNITVSGVSAQAVGIWVENTRAVVTGNTIRNLQHTGANTNTFNSAAVIGINGQFTADNQLIGNNQIYGLSATASAAVHVTGIHYSGPVTGTNVVSRNLIHSLSASSTAATLNGIVVLGGATTYANNMIRLGLDAAGNNITTALKINGISVNPSSGDPFRFYANSIYIGGTGVGTTVSNTFAMNCPTTGNTRVFQDNIFMNARSNTTTGGKHYAVTIGGTGTNPTGLTTNFNMFFAPGTGGVLGLYNSTDRTTIAAWNTATGQDANTLQADPLFKTATGSLATLDLHIPTVSPASASGTTIAGITNDFDNDPRPATAPDRGADEIVNASGGSFPTGTYFNATMNTADTLAGNVTILNNLTLTGPVNTGGFTLTLDCGASVTGAGAGNYVIGTVRKNFCAAGPFSYPVGTASGYSPVDTNVTAVGGVADALSVRAVEGYYGQNGETPALNSNTLHRYWDLNEFGSITADIKWNFLPGDVAGGGSNYQVIRISGADATRFLNAPDCPSNPNASPCVNVAGNYFFMAGVSNFSKWAAGPPLAPTAAGANIVGRILDAGGRGIANAQVVLSGGGLTQPMVVQTGPFGYYQFNDLPVGQLYVVTVRSGRHTFSEPTRVIDLTANVVGADFVAEP
jgi:hypothetical protein